MRTRQMLGIAKPLRLLSKKKDRKKEEKKKKKKKAHGPSERPITGTGYGGADSIITLRGSLTRTQSEGR